MGLVGGQKNEAIMGIFFGKSSTNTLNKSCRSGWIAHVLKGKKVRYSKWISANFIPPEFKVKAQEPPGLAPFSELNETSH